MTEAYKIGAMGTDTLTGKSIKYGSAVINNTTGGEPFTVSGSNYVVTSSKTFYGTGFYLLVLTPQNKALEIRYADNSALTTNAVTLLTIGSTSSGKISTSASDGWIPCNISAPADKYVGIYTASASVYAGVWIAGYEA